MWPLKLSSYLCQMSEYASSMFMPGVPPAAELAMHPSVLRAKECGLVVASFAEVLVGFCPQDDVISEPWPGACSLVERNHLW